MNTYFETLNTYLIREIVSKSMSYSLHILLRDRLDYRDSLRSMDSMDYIVGHSLLDKLESIEENLVEEYLFKAMELGKSNLYNVIIDGHSTKLDINRVLYHAARNGRKTVDWFYKNLDKFVGFIALESALSGAIHGNQLNLIQYFIDKGVTHLYTAMSAAIAFNNVGAMKILIENGADKNDKMVIKYAILNGSFDVIEYLLENGINGIECIRAMKNEMEGLNVCRVVNMDRLSEVLRFILRRVPLSREEMELLLIEETFVEEYKRILREFQV